MASDPPHRLEKTGSSVALLASMRRVRQASSTSSSRDEGPLQQQQQQQQQQHPIVSNAEDGMRHNSSGVLASASSASPLVLQLPRSDDDGNAMLRRHNSDALGSASSNSPMVLQHPRSDDGIASSSRLISTGSRTERTRDGEGDDLQFLSGLKQTGRRASSELQTSLAETFWKQLRRAIHDFVVKQSYLQYKEMHWSTPKYALFCLHRDMWLRYVAMRIATHRLFEAVMLLAIVANCFTLAMYSNRPDFEGSQLGRDLQVANIVFLALFGLEAVVNIVAMGFILAPGTYLRNGWHILDFAVVVLGVLDAVGIGGGTAIRSARVLRPLRAITKIERMRIIVVTLIKTIPMIIDVLVLALFFFAIFGILGIAIFGGKLQGRCGVPVFDDAVIDVADSLGISAVTNVTYFVPPVGQDGNVCRGPRIEDIFWTTINNGTTFDAHGVETPTTGFSCGWGEGAFASPDPINYPQGMFCVPYRNPMTGNGDVGWRSWDNILYSWLTIFQIVVLVTSWYQASFDTQDALNNWTWLIFFIITVIGNYLLINLAVAVIFLQFQHDNENSNRARLERLAAFEEEQLAEERAKAGQPLNDPDSLLADYDSSVEDDAEVNKFGATEAPTQRGFRLWCRTLMTDPRTEHFTMGVIIVNCIFLALQWYPMPSSLDQANDWANVAFTAYFLMEMVLKIIGLGFMEYASDSFNVFDAVVVVASVIDVVFFLLATYGDVHVPVGAAFSVLRGFRLLKIFRLLVQWKSMARLLAVLMQSLSSVGWLTILLFIIVFVWALLGMQIFGYQLAFCDAVEGSFQVCPPGMTLEECPDHWDCFVPCDPTEEGTWFNVTDSPYGGMAYCEEFPKAGGSGTLTYLAQVGKPYVPDANFDTIIQAFCIVFQIITMDDFDTIMFNCMTAVSPWSALYFVAILLFGEVMLLNLFIAIIIHSFECISESEEEQEGRNADRQVSHHAAPPYIAGYRPDSAADSAPLYKKGDVSLYETSSQDAPLSGGKPRNRVTIDDLDDYDGEGGGRSAVHKLRALSVSAAAAQRGGGVGGGRNVHQQSESHMSLQVGPAAVLTGGVTEDESAQGGSTHAKKAGGNGLSFSAIESNNRHVNSLVRRSVDAYTMPGLTNPHIHTSRKAARISQLCVGSALFMFGPTHPIRLALAHILVDKYFEWTMLFFICWSSLMLTVDTPFVDPSSKLGHALTIMNYIFVTAFGIEAIIKSIVRGFLFNGPQSYLRQPWNVLDFFIVVINLVVIIATACGVPQSTWLRALRALRALRPLRAATRFRSIKVVVHAMFQAIPALGNVVVVTITFFIIFGVLGINLFAGQLDNCQDPQSNSVLDAYYLLPSGGTINRTWCEVGSIEVTTSYYHSQLPGNVTVPPWTQEMQWVHPYQTFDNLAVASWVLFQMSTQENWAVIMWGAGESVAPGEQPRFGHNLWVQLYFVAFMTVGAFVLFKLVIGVTIDKFNQISRQNDGTNPLMTESQSEWLTIQKMLIATKLQVRYAPPQNNFRFFVFCVVFSDYFEKFIYGAIIVNILCMMTHHANQTYAWDMWTQIYNLVFTAIFVTEMLLKWIAVGVPAYFKDKWNSFDFIVVGVSVAGVLCDWAIPNSDLAYLPLLRILRAARILRVANQAKGLRMLLTTLLWSLPAVFNVASVLFLFTFVYAIMGMNLFGNNVYGSDGSGIDGHVGGNFKTFLSSMMVMYRCMTGGNWNIVMMDCMAQHGCVFVRYDYTTPDGNFTTPAFTYVDPGSAALDGIPDGWADDQCSPNPAFSIIFFMTFMVFAQLMLLELVIGVILANIQSVLYTEELPVGQTDVLRFVGIWEELDPFATSYIPVSWLTHLLVSLKPPLGVQGLNNQIMHVHSIVTSVDIPNRDNKVHFLETLHALAGRVAGAELPLEQEAQIHKVLLDRLPCKELPKYTAAHFYSAMYVQSAVRGFLARHKLRPLWEAMAREQAALDEEESDVGPADEPGSISKSPKLTTAERMRQRWLAAARNIKQMAPQRDVILHMLKRQAAAAEEMTGPRPLAISTAAGRRRLVAQQAMHVREQQQQQQLRHNASQEASGLRQGDPSARLSMAAASGRADGPMLAPDSPTSRVLRGMFQLARRNSSAANATSDNAGTVAGAHNAGGGASTGGEAGGSGGGDGSGGSVFSIARRTAAAWRAPAPPRPLALPVADDRETPPSSGLRRRPQPKTVGFATALGGGGGVVTAYAVAPSAPSRGSGHIGDDPAGPSVRAHRPPAIAVEPSDWA